MCMNSAELNSYQSKIPRIKVHGLHRRRFSKQAKESIMKKDIEMENLKLYMENQTIIEENERLRKKALLLHQENRALLSQLSVPTNFPTNT